MPTFAELKTKCALRLKDPNGAAVSAANVGASINDAIRFWRYTQFWFNEASTTVTLDTASRFIPNIPTDFLYEKPNNCGFVINYNQVNYPLEKADSQTIDILNVGGNQMPRRYCYRNNQFEMETLPDQTYTMSVYYIKDYTDLSADGDTNDFTTKADQLIIYEALSRLYAEFRQDEKMSGYFAQKAQDEKANLMLPTMRRQGSGTLKITNSIL